MRFEWDPEKARRNFTKHGVAFEEAATAFADSLSITKFDPTTPKTRIGFCFSALRTQAGSWSSRTPPAATTFESSVLRLATRRERRIYASD